MNKILEELNKEQYEQKLIELRELTLDYNKHTNLTAIRETKDFDRKNIVDSLLTCKYVD